MKIIRLNEIDSTNTYAKQLLAENKVTYATCIVASNQTSGKGMHQNTWQSEAGKNLTFSIVCFPNFLDAAKQFQLNKVVSLSVFDLLQQTVFTDNMSIKWPNDIYLGNKKAGGILIETSVIGQKMNWVVIGLGLNVNQQKFPKDLPNPASLIQVAGNKLDLENLLNTYICLFHRRYAQLSAYKNDEIDADYLKAMFRFGIPSKFVHKNKEITATITGVNEFGWLQLITDENKILECEMKEIAYVV